MAARKSLPEELNIMQRYADLTPLYFQRVQEFLASEDKNDQKFAMTLMNSPFTKMIPQTIDGSFTNRNLNSDVPATAEELDAVKSALLSAIPETGGEA